MLQTKKINLWLLLICATVMGFSACEKKPEPEPPYDGEYVELSELSFFKVTDEESNELSGFKIYLNQEGMYDENHNLIKKGNEYEINIYAESFDFAGNYRVPKEGIYEFSDYTVKNSLFGQVIAYKNTNGNADFKFFVSGKLTVKKINNGYRIDVDIVDNKGAEHKVRYEGVLKSHNYTEPEQATIINLSLSEGDIYSHHNFGNIGGTGNDVVYFSFSNQNFYFLLQFLLPSGSASIPLGTYPISEDYYWNITEVNTVCGANYSVYDDGYVSWSYDLVSGTVTVSSNGFVVNAVTQNGSTINATYEGSLNLIQY